MSKNTEQSIKHKLKNISKGSGIPFNSLLETLFLERFLVRISVSKYVDSLIFKGGMCLAQFIDLGRETKDIDFLLTKIKGNTDEIKELMQEIASIHIDDNFIFSFIGIGELSLEHKKYPGYNIAIQGELGQIKQKVSIDIGVGDVVRPRFIEIELMKSKIPLFEDKILLNAYPPEYIFSEKIEAILYHGEINSRMKDFYDCYRLIEDKAIDDSLLKNALSETTLNRGTTLSLISTNTEVFEKLWKGFLRKNRIEDLDFEKIVKTINRVLIKFV